MLARFGIREEVCAAFLQGVEDAYLAGNPYHNALHGGTVPHALPTLFVINWLSD
jgi:hypothetical protein